MENKRTNTIRRSNGQFLTTLFFRILPAQILTMLFSAVNSMADGLIGTNFLGQEAVSAIGLFAPVQLILVAVSTTLMTSSSVLCARYMGRGNAGKTKGVFSLNITLTLIITSLAALISFLFSKPIAGILGASPVNLEQVSGYVLGMGIGIIPLILGQQFVCFLSLEGQNRRSFIASSVMVLVNISMDYLLAVVLKMGVMGLAAATSLGNWAYMIIAGSFFLTKKASLKYSFGSINRKEIGTMLSVGFPNALLSLLNAFRSGIFNKTLAAYDPTMMSIAAFSPYTISYMLFQSVVQGTAGAGRMMIGISNGEEDRRSLTLIMKTLLTRGLAIVLAAAALEFVLAGPITGLYYSDKTSPIYLMTMKGLRIGTAVLILQGVGSIFSNYFQSIGRMKAVNVMSVLEGIAVMGLFALLLVPKIGIDGIWTALLVGYTVVALCGPVYAILYRKRMTKNMTEWAALPEDFGAADDERIDIGIMDLDDAINTSRYVQEFLLSRNVDEKRANYSALALEELSTRIVKECFPLDKKKNSIEVRVVHKDDDIILSLKDDCVPFNMEERANLVKTQDDPEMGLGLRVIRGITKKAEYQLALGLNVFTMTI